MLQGEFETLTGIYPDVLLYEAAEQEYNNGDWASKAEFCECFKADEDGIATKCQTAANKRWFGMEEQVGKLREENSRLEDENENLRTELTELAKRVDSMNNELNFAREKMFSENAIRIAMQQALVDAACDDNKADMILHSVWAHTYLLERLGIR